MSAAPAGPKQRLVYVAIGASDIVGVGAADPLSQAWPALVFRRLPAGTVFHRLGVSGSLASEAVEYLLPTAVAAEPDLATVWLAVNDFNHDVPLDAYASDLDKILRSMSAAGARTFAGNIPDMSAIPKYADLGPGVLRAATDAWNDRIAEVVAGNGATLVDLFHPSRQNAGRGDLVSEQDQFHPSAAGYQALADLFLDAIATDTVIGWAIR
jgi:lysophospholipase L1-like esterase